MKALAVAALAALGWAVAPGAEAQRPIQIGASASKTGEYAALGQNQLRGYQLCVKHVNEKGGALGRKLELVVDDDQSAAATAIRIYERLITHEKVDLVLGPYSSPITEPVADLIDFNDAVAITQQMKQLDVNSRMYVATVGVAVPKFYEALGRTAEFVYGVSNWEPELVTLRAGGLIPIARRYPGAREFVEAHKREYPSADLSYATAAGYGGCQVLTEAHQTHRVPGPAEDQGCHPEARHQYAVWRVQGGPGWPSDRAHESDVPVAGRQAGDRLARGAGGGEGALPHPAVEPAPVSRRRS
jgi:ABC-type branched-subunit amino acid transport system substrate-binding protein